MRDRAGSATELALPNSHTVVESPPNLYWAQLQLISSIVHNGLPELSLAAPAATYMAVYGQVWDAPVSLQCALWVPASFFHVIPG